MTVLSDKRLWGALIVVVLLRYVAVGLFSLTEPPVSADPVGVVEGPAPTRPPVPETGPMADLRRTMTRHRVPVVNADGSPAGPLLSPLQASAAFGGIVMLVGGIGAVWLWRRAEISAREEPDGVVRNSAAPPGSLL